MTNMTLIEIQEQYIETVNAGQARWSHRPEGGHSRRIADAAWGRAEKALRRLGWSDQTQIDQVIRDARDMAILLRKAS